MLGGIVPGGHGGGEEEALRARWEHYVSALKGSDPEEYEALLQDMNATTNDDIAAVSPEVATSVPNDPGVEFSPKLPGGTHVLGNDGVEVRPEALEVTPVPAFVVKTKDLGGQPQRKVFINICQSPLIQKTSTKKHLTEDGQEQEGVSIPLSLGPPRSETDKKGAPSTVYDIIVHPSVVSDAEADTTGSYRNFLCELALQYVEQKYKCELDPKFKLPRMKYKGDSSNPPKQHVRKQQAPIIEEVGESASSGPGAQAATKAAQPAKSSSRARRLPVEHVAFSLHRRSADGAEVAAEPVLGDPSPFSEPESGVRPETLILQASLPRLEASSAGSELAGVLLSLSPEFLVLKVPGLYRPLELYLPSPVVVSQVLARFDAPTQTLRVELPINAAAARDPCGNAEPDHGSRPWLLTNALRHGGAEDGPKAAASSAAEQPGHSLAAETVVKEDDVLPEDRFHRTDIVSQHIKDERVKQRVDKQREWVEKERLKALEEGAAKQREAQAVLEQAAAELDAEVEGEQLPREEGDVELF